MKYRVIFCFLIVSLSSISVIMSQLVIDMDTLIVNYAPDRNIEDAYVSITNQSPSVIKWRFNIERVDMPASTSINLYTPQFMYRGYDTNCGEASPFHTIRHFPNVKALVGIWGILDAQNYLLDVVPLLFRVQIKNEDCGNILNSFMVKVIDIRTSSTTDLKSENKLFPNPASNHIFCPRSINVDFTIYDNLGRIILHNTNSTGEIDVSSLKSGIYHFVYYDGQRRQTNRFVKD